MMRKASFLAILLLGAVVAASGSALTDAAMVNAIVPHVAHLKLKPDDLRALAERQVLARGLATRNAKVMAGFAVAMTDAPPEAFVEAFRTLANFNQSQNVIAYRRFSDTPALADFNGLTVDSADLFALSRCQAGDCGVKLSGQEIERIRAVIGPADRLTPKLKLRLADEYKRILLDRLRAYAKGGTAAMGIYTDKEDPVNASESFHSLAREQVESYPDSRAVCDRLEKSAPGRSESFFYWSVQKYNKLKPVINLIHVVIHTEGGRVFIASKQVYASHYTEAALGVAELIPFRDARGQARTIIAFNLRLQVDLLGGAMGFLKKRMSQPKIVSALKDSLAAMCGTLEVSARAAGQ